MSQQGDLSGGKNFNSKITLWYYLKKQYIKHMQHAIFSCVCNIIICEKSIKSLFSPYS